MLLCLMQLEYCYIYDLNLTFILIGNTFSHILYQYEHRK